jgi:hypothetical protein
MPTALAARDEVRLTPLNTLCHVHIYCVEQAQASRTAPIPINSDGDKSFRFVHAPATGRASELPAHTASLPHRLITNGLA